MRAAGYGEILAFLRAGKRTKPYLGKLLLLGEAKAGKTSLGKLLRNLPLVANEPETHGVAVHSVDLPHPILPGITIHLQAWDFGGQQIQYPTHQFFITDESLILLLWDRRSNYAAGERSLFYWLNTIEARAPRARVIIAATYCEEHAADIDFYGLIKGRENIHAVHYSVGLFPSKDTAPLLDAIHREAAALPSMAWEWPERWSRARKALAEKRVAELQIAATPQVLALLTDTGLPADDAEALASALHTGGEILYYKDKVHLKDFIVLDPEWATSRVALALKDPQVTQRGGLFTRADMERLWPDLDHAQRDFLLRLMDEFDIGYGTGSADPNKLGILTALLPTAPSEYGPQWDAASRACQTRVVYRFASAIPAGIPSWFIARSHPYHTDHRWRSGVLLRETQQKSLALVQADQEARSVSIAVRGSAPAFFLGAVREIFRESTARYPGLDRKLKTYLLCPRTYEGTPCKGEFEEARVLKRLEKGHEATLDCSVCGEDVRVADLLYGIGLGLTRFPDPAMAILQRLDERTAENLDAPPLLYLRTPGTVEILELHDEWLRSASGKGEQLELCLHCMYPPCPHIPKHGVYSFEAQSDLFRAIAPTYNRIAGWLKSVAPFLEAQAGAPGGTVELIPTISPDTPGELASTLPRSHRPKFLPIEYRRAIRQLLERLDWTRPDPAQHKGGLVPFITKEGDLLWLCPAHHKELTGTPFGESYTRQTKPADSN